MTIKAKEKSTDERSLLLTLEEISQLAAQDGDPAATLGNIVRLIQRRFHTDVCSVYLLEPDRAHLVLAATVGLRPESVGRVRMSLKEGLAGLAAERLQPVVVADATTHPRFKYFEEAGEDLYHSFVGLPLLDGGLVQGVLVVQTVEPRGFSEDEIRMLLTASRQLGSLVSEARTLEQFSTPTHERLHALASNLWWSWDPDGADLFRELDPVRWSEVHHNPIALLREIPFNKLELRAGQFLMQSRINYEYRRLQEYLRSERTWGATHCGVLRARPVAYFSAEFGLHESMPIYSGGLGVLAGDHIKSASDLGVPLVGIGLLYKEGYFRQRIDRNGWQQEEYIRVHTDQLPVTPATGPDGRPVEVRIETRGGSISARVWQAAVGRCTLLLLDSDLEGNAAEDRELTARLYGGDDRVRIRQELLLGVGGVRALRALGISPGVLHLNEGHSAFAALEVMRHRMASEGIRFDEAARRVSRQTVFTTHTPVPAGHDRFCADLIEEHLGPLRDSLGISPEHLMGLGRVNPWEQGEAFCMTVLALRHSHRANAVSCLHGEVSRAMWTCLWQGRPEEEVPIGHITNGVHVLTWLAPAMHQTYARHLGPDWYLRSGQPEAWENIESVDDGELWETHVVLKARLLSFVRQVAARQAARRGEPQGVVDALSRALIPDALTIGFARRFATYKRADMVFRDLERIAELVNDPQRPIQFVFAGKAHPRDHPGKEVLREIFALGRDPRFAGKVVFLEDYDMDVARHLIQGVDVWLNNPRRPLEASGTSGQKVVLNGGLNLSVLDGWWAEAYDGANGFAIGGGETHTSTEIHDERDMQALLETLTREVIPLYYQRDPDGLPRAWIGRMKRAIRTLGWRFNADRMVMDYVRHCYVPAAGGTSSAMPG
jgi:glycogen phosphorylase